MNIGPNKGLWLYTTATLISLSIFVWIRHEKEWISTSMLTSHTYVSSYMSKVAESHGGNRDPSDREERGAGTEDISCGTTRCHHDRNGPSSNRAISVDRIHYSNMSLAHFRDYYVGTQTPVVITGLTEDWPARKWSIESLSKVCHPYPRLFNLLSDFK